MFALLDILVPAQQPATIDNEELLLALCVGIAACYIAWAETYVNLRAMIWSGLCLLFAIVLCRARHPTMHPSQGTEQQSDAAKLKPI
jgi:hypothetical protein